jgi:hypothetical protein
VRESRALYRATDPEKDTTMQAGDRVSRRAVDLLRALRRAVAYDQHTQRLWHEALARGYSDTWVARRLAELFPRT